MTDEWIGRDREATAMEWIDTHVAAGTSQETVRAIASENAARLLKLDLRS